MAAMLLAAKVILGAREWGTTVSLAFAMGEENGFDGARHLAASGFRADGAVVGESTGLDVVAAHKGVVRWQMTTTGKSAHSATPQAGINAIGLMARLVQALDDRLLPPGDHRGSVPGESGHGGVR